MQRATSKAHSRPAFGPTPRTLSLSPYASKTSALNGKEQAKHLMGVLHKLYTISYDWEGRRYLGIKLNWVCKTERYSYPCYCISMRHSGIFTTPYPEATGSTAPPCEAELRSKGMRSEFLIPKKLSGQYMYACICPSQKIHRKGVLDMPVRTGRLLRQWMFTRHRWLPY